MLELQDIYKHDKEELSEMKFVAVLNTKCYYK